jgi:hypothetical protein
LKQKYKNKDASEILEDCDIVISNINLSGLSSPPNPN